MCTAVAGHPIVENFLAGYNSSIFAYGQTGAGKTHTMIGQLGRSDQASKTHESEFCTESRIISVFASCCSEQKLRLNVWCDQLCSAIHALHATLEDTCTCHLSVTLRQRPPLVCSQSSKTAHFCCVCHSTDLACCQTRQEQASQGTCR